jgi:hypothetical protein
MVSLRGAAFVLGAVGLTLFLAGAMWALLAPPDSTCTDPTLKGIACERHNYGILLTRVMYVVFAGLILEASAVVMLMLHLSRGGTPPRSQPPRPPQGPPRNRYLTAPVQQRPAAPSAPLGRNGKRS